MDFVEWGFLCTNSALFKSDLTKSLISMIRLLTHVSSLGMMCYMRETSSALENVTCKCWSFCAGLNALGWRHQMETFSTLLSLCAGNQPATDGFPHKETVTRTSDVSLLSVQTNYWTNTRLPGNWRRHDGLWCRRNVNSSDTGNTSCKLGQYHGCCCPDSLRGQAISKVLCYWICRINRSLFTAKNNFNHIGVKNRWKFKFSFIFLKEIQPHKDYVLAVIFTESTIFWSRAYSQKLIWLPSTPMFLPFAAVLGPSRTSAAIDSNTNWRPYHVSIERAIRLMIAGVRRIS